MNPDLNAEPVIIPLNKLKLSAMFLGALIFVGLGVWIVNHPSTFATGIFRFLGDTGGTAVGWASIIFFGVCAIMIFRKFFENKSGLVINREGIMDNSSGVSAGLIAWADITGLTVRQVYNQKFIMILVENPEVYIERHTNALKRSTVKLNHQMYGSPISISANSLKCSFDELYAILTERLNKHREV
ncbi:MAG: STM3941 family protein [Mucilaginibacter sp.]